LIFKNKGKIKKYGRDRGRKKGENFAKDPDSATICWEFGQGHK
jgi:hypothetical protein